MGLYFKTETLNTYQVKHRPEAQNLRLKASRRELAGKLKKHVVRREVKKSTRGGKEGGAQDAKRVADMMAHMQIFLDIHV